MAARKKSSAPEWLEAIRRIDDLDVEVDVSLAAFTSFRIGGPADCVVAPRSAEAAASLLRAVRSHAVPMRVLGGGTNVLISDAGLRGIVVNLTPHFSFLREEKRAEGGARWYVGAGCGTGRLVRRAVERSLLGMEALAGVPGSLGGALIMNAGGHEGEIGTSVETVELVLDGQLASLRRAQCGFAYRKSAFPKGSIILAANLLLTPGKQAVLRAQVRAMQERRRRTQPLSFPNAGSIFKNPPNDFAGRLIEAAGCKGWREGDAEVSTLHANFIINLGHATSAEVARLARRVQDRVREESGVVLQLEVVFLGEFAEGARPVDPNAPMPEVSR